MDGFVSRSDLQRSPFRILLFGLISLLEMRMLHLVRKRHSETQAAEALNNSRLQKALRLHNDRKRWGEELRDRSGEAGHFQSTRISQLR